MKRSCNQTIDNFLRTSTAIVALTIVTNFAAQAVAQTVPTIAPPNPIRPAIDANSVDLFNGAFAVDGPSISVGSASSQFNYHAWNYGGIWSDITNPSITISTATLQVGTVVTVSTGETSDGFTYNGSGYVSTEGNGGTLVLSGSNYNYTAHDGTVTTFVKPVGSNTWYPNGTLGQLNKIVRPDGETITYKWASAYCQIPQNANCQNNKAVFKITSIQSSNGFVFAPTYASNATTINSTALLAAWYQIDSVQLYNIAASSTAVASQHFSNTTVNSINYYNITDNIGNQYRYRMSAQGVAGIMTPANTSETVSVTYNTSSPYRVMTVVNANGTNNYASSDSGNTRTVTVTDAQSHVSTYNFDIPSHRMNSYTDPLGHTTSYQYDSYGRYVQSTRPEGNYTQISYDARGNVTQVTSVAKSGSGLANTVIMAGYDASCGNAVKCNQPNWTQDALGNETDYTYDPTSALLTSITKPAAASGGVRPQTSGLIPTFGTLGFERR